MGGIIKNFIDPTQLPEEADVIASLIDAGVNRSDVEWLAEIMTSEGFLPDSFLQRPHFDRRETLDDLAHESGKIYHIAGNRDVALSLLLIDWLSIRHPHYFAQRQTYGESDLQSDSPWLRRFFELALEVKWAEGVNGVAKLSGDPRLSSVSLPIYGETVIEFFLYSEFLPEEIRISVFQRMLKNVSLEHTLNAAIESGYSHGVLNERDRLEHCLKFDLMGGLYFYLDMNRNLDDTTFGMMALGVYNIVGRMHNLTTSAESASNIDFSGLSDVLLLYFEELDRRRAQNRGEALIERSFWQYAQPLHYFGTSPAVAGFSLGGRDGELLTEALNILGNLRQLVRDDKLPSDDYRLDRSYLLSIQTYVKLRGGTWRALKILLLVFSNLPDQSVARDLRYWHETDRDPVPNGIGSWVADRIAQLFHSLKEQQQADPKLEELRSSFADFCVGRLKPRGFKDVNESSKEIVKEDELTEPRKVWRFAYIQALTELKINPKGRGHRVLFWASKFDPDEDVRKAAKNAYTLLRHHPEWPEDLSPRRALFGAFWWLRQAHLIQLGVAVDPAGAKRTRSKEITWTTRLS